ncbi:dienelactone hydrolase [Paenibacillus thermoaerophilus]|nr:alpha/beta hydrolase family protein [Paenibacillus thermoaerophilus]TMV17514.1 dienelactone hydrolase [Paenibacillus thermoaerophilus]
MWNPDDYLKRLYDVYAEKRSGAGRAERAERLRQLGEALGSFPEREDELNPVLLERVRCGGYVRERVEYGTGDGLRVPAYVLIPDGGEGAPRPAVLALHGHGFGSREIVGLRPDGSGPRAEPTIHGDYALELVRRGFVVLAPEIVGFGDRRLKADQADGKTGNNSCARLAAHLLMYGKSLAGLRVFEARRALDYLAARPDVDAGRLGCMGFSGGALIAAYTSALDERIRALYLTGFANTFRDSILAMPHCIDNYVPGLLRYAELPEWIGLVAPRPLFIEAGADDPIFPLAGVRAALAELERIYAQAGVPEALGSDIFPGRHEVGGRLGYDWLAGIFF